jgi:hypothetical protein
MSLVNNVIVINGSIILVNENECVKMPCSNVLPTKSNAEVVMFKL